MSICDWAQDPDYNYFFIKKLKNKIYIRNIIHKEEESIKKFSFVNDREVSEKSLLNVRF